MNRATGEALLGGIVGGAVPERGWGLVWRARQGAVPVSRPGTPWPWRRVDGPWRPAGWVGAVWIGSSLRARPRKIG
jgi:hypothetical protein